MPYETLPQEPASPPPAPSAPSTFRPSPLNPHPPRSSPIASSPPHARPSPQPMSSALGHYVAASTADPARDGDVGPATGSGSSHEGSLSSLAAQSPNRVPRSGPSRRSQRPQRDSYAEMYGAPASVAGPDAGSLNAIAAGLVGGAYGPFPQELTAGGMNSGQQSSLAPAGSGVSLASVGRGGASMAQPRWTSVAAEGGSHGRAGSQSGSETLDFLPALAGGGRPRSALMASAATRESFMSVASGYESSDAGGNHGVYGLGPADTTEDSLWKEENKEPDDYLHDPDPILDRQADRRVAILSKRGWLNMISLFVLIGGLIAMFACWPIITYVIKRAPGSLGWNLGGINGSGQYPDIPNLPQLIDRDTPDGAKTHTGFDGNQYELVFSDEFNKPGRTFWPGDDPFWEAVDIHYWQTTNFEWYDPDAAQTRGGSLELTLTEQPNHDLSFRSGMIQSWNQFCFTEGYVEINVSLPGRPSVTGLWPGAWTMGNLARAGYGASNDGMWPYSYVDCDVGTLPNQTWPNGSSPTAAKTSGSSDYGGELSYLVGQRVSACTCSSDDHPGPNHNVGRSGPEIDIIEAQYGYGPGGALGSASQSLQIAPMNAAYAWDNSSRGMTIHNVPAVDSQAPNGTLINLWHGSINQESLSGITITDGVSYNGAGWQTFGFEYKRGFDSDGAYITWSYNGQPTWTVHAAAIGADPETQISARPVSMEPMYIILNLGLSSKFQTVMWNQLQVPAVFRVDYVRVYQRQGSTNVGCDPKDYPTADYIKNHLAAYKNPNATTWAEAGYSWPKNRLKDTC